MNWEQLWVALGETLQMTLPSTLIAYLIGLPLGVMLVITRRGGIMPMPTFNAVAGAIVNFLRSIPFIILLAMLFPVARMVEGSFNEVDNGIIEAAQSMGSSTFQIIRKVLIPEAMPSLINGFAICMTTILGYTAMASAAGGGGLGALAITRGLTLRQYDVMYAASIVLVILVQIITMLGSYFTRKFDHRIR